MSDAYSTGGHITVQRDIHGNKTQLCEVWELEHLAWLEDNAGDYDVVKVHIADINDVPSNGVPHSSDRITDSCKFEKVPGEVRQEFAKQAANLQTAIEELH